MPTEPWFSYIPEINAARIIGPGPAAWMVAAATWAIQAAEAAAAQAIFHAQTGIQAANIDGGTSDAIASKIPPFAAWLANLNAEAARATLEHMQVAQAYTAALVGTVPLPVIAANRAVAAASHAASAVGAVNPAGVAADAAYAGFQAQNAAAMTGYDTLAQAATTPRSFSPPPPLTSGGEGILSGGDVLSSIANHMQSDPAGLGARVAQMQSQLANPSVVQNLQAAASQNFSQFASTPLPLSPAHMQAAQMAMYPAQMLMNQLAAPTGGVWPNGLVGGAGAMMPGTANKLGGLPLSMSGGSGGSSGAVGSSSTAGAGGGIRGLGSGGSLARMLAGAGALSPGVGGGVKPFMGLPPVGGGEGAGAGAGAGARSPGGMPMGAMPGAQGSGSGGGKSSKLEAEDIVVVDPIAEQEKLRKAQAIFR